MACCHCASHQEKPLDPDTPLVVSLGYRVEYIEGSEVADLNIEDDEYIDPDYQTVKWWSVCGLLHQTIGEVFYNEKLLKEMHLRRDQIKGIYRETDGSRDRVWHSETMPFMCYAKEKNVKFYLALDPPLRYWTQRMSDEDSKKLEGIEIPMIIYQTNKKRKTTPQQDQTTTTTV